MSGRVTGTDLHLKVNPECSQNASWWGGWAGRETAVTVGQPAEAIKCLGQRWWSLGLKWSWNKVLDSRWSCSCLECHVFDNFLVPVNVPLDQKCTLSTLLIPRHQNNLGLYPYFLLFSHACSLLFILWKFPAFCAILKSLDPQEWRMTTSWTLMLHVKQSLSPKFSLKVIFNSGNSQNGKK